MSNPPEKVAEESQNILDNRNKNERKNNELKKRLHEVTSVVKDLEGSLLESQLNDKALLLKLHMDEMKNQRLSSQLEDAKKENKQLLNVLQQKCADSASRSMSRSQIDMSSSYSTVSMVHLQYKYEELLENYEGLLKVLDNRSKDVQNCYKENENFREEIDKLSASLFQLDLSLKKLCSKYLSLKERKNRKIKELKAERDTLRLVYDQMVDLLNRQTMADTDYLREKLQNSTSPDKALLIQEIRRSNALQYENNRLKWELSNTKCKLEYTQEKLAMLRKST